LSGAAEGYRLVDGEGEAPDVDIGQEAFDQAGIGIEADGVWRTAFAELGLEPGQGRGKRIMGGNRHAGASLSRTFDGCVVGIGSSCAGRRLVRQRSRGMHRGRVRDGLRPRGIAWLDWELVHLFQLHAGRPRTRRGRQGIAMVVMCGTW
jgi:hypothetical protein